MIAICSGVMSAPLQISLLTCEPGPAVYEHYGHTALRVRGEFGGDVSDVVFNYGCFDFNTPNFGLRFALGQTDYMLCAVPFEFFRQEYAETGRRVWEQPLNLTEEEAGRLLVELIVSARPENRVYRYNFLYNNCTTKCRDVIEEVTGGRIVCGAERSTTYRRMMHEFNDGYPWANASIDLCLGSGADREIGARESHFAPMALLEDMKEARLADGRRAVTGTTMLVAPDKPYEAPWTGWRWVVCGVIAAIGALLLAGGKTGYRVWICRAVWLATGAASLVVAFLFLFSEHPTVDSNWLLLTFNPLALFLPFVRGKVGRALAQALICCSSLTVILLLCGVQCASPIVITYIILYIVTLWRKTQSDRGQ